MPLSKSNSLNILNTNNNYENDLINLNINDINLKNINQSNNDYINEILLNNKQTAIDSTSSVEHNLNLPQCSNLFKNINKNLNQTTDLLLIENELNEISLETPTLKSATNLDINVKKN